MWTQWLRRNAAVVFQVNDYFFLWMTNYSAADFNWNDADVFWMSFVQEFYFVYMVDTCANLHNSMLRHCVIIIDSHCLSQLWFIDETSFVNQEGLPWRIKWMGFFLLNGKPFWRFQVSLIQENLTFHSIYLAGEKLMWWEVVVKIQFNVQK